MLKTNLHKVRSFSKHCHSFLPNTIHEQIDAPVVNIISNFRIFQYKFVLLYKREGNEEREIIILVENHTSL